MEHYCTNIRETALILAAFWMIGAFPLPLAAQGNHTHSTITDKPSTHGMMFFGGEAARSVYASHLPMFHTPHDYQVLLELEIPDSVRTAYEQSLTVTPKETIYTLVPEVFVLPKMIAKPRPFTAQLYCGHFERGGKPIAGTFTVSIRRVLHFKKFDTSAKRLKTSEYLVFGSPKAQYAAHMISAKPDFDHIVRLENAPLNTSELNQANTITVFSLNRANTPLQMGRVQAKNMRTGKLTTMQIGASLYLEFDDLK